MFKSTFILKIPNVANFAEIIKTGNTLIKKTFKDSKKVTELGAPVPSFIYCRICVTDSRKECLSTPLSKPISEQSQNFLIGLIPPHSLINFEIQK